MIKRSLALVALTGLLGACGFHLRGTGGESTRIALSELNLTARNAYGETQRLLRSQLEANGVKVYASAPYELVLTRETEKRRTASYTSTSRSMEYELSTTLEYELLDTRKLQLGSNELTVQKVYVHDQNNITGSTQEALQLREEMRREMVQQLILRLQQLTPERLAQMEKQAQERARAEAQAAEAAQRAQEEQQNEPQQSPLDLPTETP
ncbi:LPS-assembly lipoprotein LptE [Azotobacter beijerinckii]|uniref:LPS-assembly lipoprotein LptE n=1 Tax=Azotobacter beijerinckii TaxID=170623 RepID=UPI002953CDC9|nr:LPS assembly lipoprotein LptE [Azotobacter beijerinckii]MDV7213641.1 LPS assembly lipoprotein LptE [Azotobacter beijerinckii]